MDKRPLIELRVNRLRQTFLQSLWIAGAGLLVAFLWLGAIREPLSLATSKAQLAQVAVDSRAHIIALYLSDLEERTEQLADLIEPYATTTTLIPETAGFPDAVTVSYIPLGDLGTVRLNPGDHGLRSHIDIDIVRRAFTGEEPPPESIAREGTTYTLIARGSGEPIEGVVLVEMTNTRLNQLVSASSEGQYQLMQRRGNGDAFSVAGSLRADASASSRVAGSLWSLEFEPNDEWLAVLQPAWWSLIGAILIALGAFSFAAFWLLSRPPQVLDQEISRITAQAEQGLTITLNTPSLLPLVKSLLDKSAIARRRGKTLSSSSQSARADDGSSQNVAERPPEADEMLAVSAESAWTGKPGRPETETDDGIPEHIFQDTGVRGLAGSELSDDLIEKVGCALAVLCAEKGISSLLIAHDGRSSTNKISNQLIKSFAASGVDVLDLGEVSLPLLQFASHISSTQSGIVITGSADRSELINLQIILNRQLVTGQGIEDIMAAVKAGVRKSGTGRVAKQAITTTYTEKVLSDVSVALPLKVVLSQTQGNAASIAIDIIEALGCEVVSANIESGSLSIEEAHAQMGQAVVDAGADLGVLLDSQGARLSTFTNEGSPVNSDQLLMILARDMLERNPGADVVYDINFTRHFAPFITRCGGRAHMARSGRIFVEEKLNQTQALIAATFYGHIFFSERWFGFSDAIYAMSRLLEVISIQSHSYQALVSDLPQAVSTPEITVPLENAVRKKVMRALVSHPHFPGARITTLDGLRIDYADGWGLIRNSTAESGLIIRLEGNDSASLSRIKGVLQNAISEAAPELTISL